MRKAIGDCQSFLRFQDKLLFFACQCTDAPDPDRDASEGRIKMIRTSDHAFENGHATPLEARTHFGRNARQLGNSDVTNLVIVGRSAASSRLLASINLVVTNGDFWDEKLRQAFNLNRYIFEPAFMAGRRRSYPRLIWFAVDLLLRCGNFLATGNHVSERGAPSAGAALNAMTPRRFPPPWSVEEQPACIFLLQQFAI